MEVQALSPEDIENIVDTESRNIPAEDIYRVFRSNSIDLISKGLGSRIVGFSDEWFAAAENLIEPAAPITKPGVFTYAGAWYDGWETRRHNPSPFDWVVIRLGVGSGRVKGVEIDTAFFDGNHAPAIAVEGCVAEDDKEEAMLKRDFKGWQPILEKKECGPSCRQAWLLESPTTTAFTHVRLLMFPDGGIARFRLYGEAVPLFSKNLDEIVDLAAAVNGGVATRCSDQHFGTKDNLLLPGRGKDMGDGWETKRSRGVHIDWVIVRLGAAGEIDRIVVDTAHFRGNFPKQVQIFAATGPEEPGANDHERWRQILAPTSCRADDEHEFQQRDYSLDVDAVKGQNYRFVKMVIIPDGGVKRLRVYGRRAA